MKHCDEMPYLDAWEMTDTGEGCFKHCFTKMTDTVSSFDNIFSRILRPRSAVFRVRKRNNSMINQCPSDPQRKISKLKFRQLF